MRSLAFLLIFWCNILSASYLYSQKARTDSLFIALVIAKEDTNKVNILNQLSAELANKRSVDSAMQYAMAAKLLAEKIDYKKGIAKASNTIGVIYDNEGNFSEALKNYSYSLKIKQQTGDEQDVADSYNNIGLINLNTGNYPEALKYLLMALKIYESAPTEQMNKNKIAYTYMNIGALYSQEKNYKEALKYYDQELNMMLQTGDKDGLALCYVGIGNIFLFEDNYDSALANYFEALKIQQEMKNKNDMALTYSNISIIYEVHLHNYAEAMKYSMMALDIWKENGDKNHIATAYVNIGGLFIGENKYDEGRKYLLDGLRVSKEIGAKNNLRVCYHTLADLSQRTGDYKSAYEYHKLYSEMQDTLLNESNNKQIAEMKTKYESEKKDKEISLLNKDKELQAVKIDKQKATVQYIISAFVLLILFAAVAFRLYNQKRKNEFQRQVSETEMKALLSQIDSHFISNTLVSVKNYLYNNDAKSSIAVTDKFSVLMREVLANSRKKEITLKEELDTLENYLQIQKVNHNHKFDFEIKTADNINAEEIYVPPMMMQPFAENSIKHAFSEMNSGGMIRINIGIERLHATSLLSCTIDDNGIGRKKSSSKKDVYNSSAINNNHNHGLGMQVIKERLDILNKKNKTNARYEIEDIMDSNNIAGTRVHLFLPFET